MKLYNHPEYDAKLEKYIEARDLYQGEQKILKSQKYLWPHELELQSQGQGIRAIREQRSAYTNFVEPIISLWTSLFFKKDPILEDEATIRVLGEDLENIDGKGASLNTFIQDKILINSMLYGMPIIQVSALGDRPANLGIESQSKKYKPIAEIISPIDFVDWAIEVNKPESLNKLKFCRYEYKEEQLRETAQDPIQYIEKSLEYRINQTDNLEKIKYVKKKKDGKDTNEWEVESSQEFTDWQEIPIVLSINISWIKDLVPHVLKYFNLESVIDNICLYQAHQRIFLIGDLSKTQVVAATEYCYSNLPQGSTIETIEPTNTQAVEARLGQVLNNIFRIAYNQTRMMSQDSNAVQSSDTIKQEKEGVYNLISAQAKYYEKLVNDMLVLMAKYKGQDIKPNFRFNIDANDINIDAFIKLIALFKDELSKIPNARKQLISKVLSDVGVDSNEQINLEIDMMVNQNSVSTEQDIRSRLLNGITRTTTV